MVENKHELIEKDLFKIALQRRYNDILSQGDCFGSIASTINGVILLLDSVPIVNLKELDSYKQIIHAHWIKNSWNDYSCSNCNNQLIGHGAGTWKYCPDCGAKMDEKEDK